MGVTPAQLTYRHRDHDVFIGRAAEMARLKDRLVTVSSGQPSSVFVCGEAGVGKTRLVQELVGVAAENGFLVLEGRASTFGSELPYAPIVDAVRNGLSRVDRGAVRQLVEGLPDLSRLFPEWYESTDVFHNDHAEFAKTRLFESIRLLLERLACAQPILFVVDDLPEVDDASLAWIDYFIRRTRASSVLLVATCRSDNRHARFQNLMRSLDRQQLISLLEVRPLTDASVSAMITARLQGSVDDAVVTTISDWALGNPLFVEALVGSWKENGVLWTKGGTWRLSDDVSSFVYDAIPHRVKSLIEDKIRLLADQERDILGLLSVSPSDVGEEVIRTAAELDGERFRIAIQRLYDARLVVDQYDNAQLMYRIAHPMMKEVTQAGLSATTRRHYHRAMMRAWQLQRPGELFPIAYHARQANVTAQPDWLISLFTRTGEQCFRLFAYQLAAEYLSEAIAVGLRHPEHSDANTILTLRLRRLEAWTLCGRVDESAKEWVLLSEQFELRHDRLSRVRLHRVMAQFESTRAFHACIGHMDAAYEIWDGTSDNEDIAWMLSEQVTASLNTGDLTAGLLALSRLTDFASRFPTAINRLTAKVRELQFVIVDWRRCYQVVNTDLILSEALQLHDESIVYDAYGIGGFYALNQGKPQVAIRLGLEGSERMRQRGMIPHEMSLCIMTMCGYFASGQWTQALEMAAYIEQQSRPLHMDAVLLCVSDLRALIHELQGQKNEAARYLKESSRLAKTVYTDSVRGALTVNDERGIHIVDAARAALDVNPGTDRGVVRVQWSIEHGLHFLLRAMEGEWLTAQSRFSDVHELTEQLRTASPDGPNLYRAIADYLDGLVCMKQNEVAAAERLLQQSVNGLAQFELPFERAKMELRWAEAALEQNPDDSLSAALRSLETFTRLDAKPYSQQARRIVQRLGGSARGRRPSKSVYGTTAMPMLSGREVEIARLVVEGLTNRQIATQLFLSPRTVDTHLQRIYKKLDIQSRTALVKQFLDL